MLPPKIKNGFVAAICIMLVGTTLEAAPVQPLEVELITDSELLQPSTTVEFRFGRPVIEQNAVGSVAIESPIVIEPPLPGKFTWLSRRSGVYVPDAAPRLGVEYSFTLRDGFTSSDGKILGAGFQAKLRTPAFGVSATKGGADDESPPQPEVFLAFNLAVSLEGAERLFQFVDGSGRRVAARVRNATGNDYFQIVPDAEDWEERWRLAHNPSARQRGEPDEEESSETAGKPLPNRIAVAPVAALGSGGPWRLEIAPGLKSQGGEHQITAPLTIDLGLVKPFRLTVLEPSNYINSGRSVTLRFSHPIAPDITGEAGARFFRFEPAVPQLRFEESWDAIVIRGEFEVGKDYRIEVDPAVVAASGLPLEGERSHIIRFEPVKPRVYLPEITAHQLRGGTRKFAILSANLSSLHITARLVSPGDLPRALATFKKYEKEVRDEASEREPYQRLPDGAIKGRLLAERTIELAAGPVDARQTTHVNWNELLGDQASGAVFVTVSGQPVPELTGKQPAAQALLQLTDLGVLWKKTAEDIRLSVFSMATGTALDRAAVTLLDDQWKQIAVAATDAQGTASLALAPRPTWIVVRHGADVHALRIGVEATDLPMWAFRVPIGYSDWESASPSQTRRAFLFTDRPLYQPGETVHVKGIVRQFAAHRLAPAPSHGGTLKLSDGRGGEVWEMEIMTDQRGAFDAHIPLSSVASGEHSLKLELADETDTWQPGFSCSFQVADYQPNAFELVLALPDRLSPEEDVSAAVTARYLFGAPLTKAEAQWTVRHVREPFSAAGFAEFQFGAIDIPDENVLTVGGKSPLRGSEPLLVRPQLPVPKGSPSRGVLTVEVTDINQQTVSETRPFVRDASELYLGIAPLERSVFRSGEVVSTRVVAVQPDGQPTARPVPVKAELIRLRRETVRVQGAGNAISFRTDTIEEPVAQFAGTTLLPSREGENWRLRDGETARFIPTQPGEYRIRVKASDAGGREALSESSFQVAGSGETVWDYRNPAQVDLVADQAEYQAGDTARLLVKTPISGEALISIERGETVLRTLRVRLEGNAPTIEVPIDEHDAPNIFVSVVILRGAEQSTRKFKTADYRYGLCMLRVIDPTTRLKVEVKPVRGEVEPGDEVETEVLVRDGAGAAVADAEVTFFAVDDGILALTGYVRPAPASVFEEPFPLRVRTGLTLFQLLPEDPGDLEFGNKGYLIGGGGLHGPSAKLRRDFPGTACWMPSLRTDQDGRLRVKFKAPDALTRYRLVAVVHAAASLFGSGESSFAIRKKLMLLPALGQFANVGDELLARAVIRNDTGADGTAEIGLILDDTSSSPKPATARIALRNGEAKAVEFPAQFRRTGSAEWKWSARMETATEAFADEVVSTLTVGSPTMLLRETYLTDLREKNNDLTIGVNPQLLEGAGTVAVTVSNTRLASLREAVTQLREYPYGCAEQTVSALVPWLVSRELGAVLPEFSKADEEAAIRGAVDKIFSMQTESGGIAFWPGGREPSLFASAYAAVALSLLEKREVALPEGWEQLLTYLSNELRSRDKPQHEDQLTERLLSLFALAAAGRPEPAYHEQLFRRRGELAHESRALLALAILEARGSAAMVKDLLNARKPAPDSFSYFGGPARDRAIRLMAWSRHDPGSGEIGRLTKELLQYRTQGHWGSTQDNAWAVMALARYYAAVERGAKPVAGAVGFGDQNFDFHLTKQRPVSTFTSAFNPAASAPAIVVRNPKKDILFGEARFLVRPPVDIQPRQDRGYAVSRRYAKLTDDGAIVEAADLRVGDRILVTLRVESARPGHFVAIDDPLPSIFEAVNPTFASRAIGGGEALARDWPSDHREIRSDRVLIFCDHLPAGAFTFRYLARVRAAGTVTAPSTKAEEMYRPERFGLAEAVRLTSKAAEAQ